jgi:DNA-binding MarR family transcriptional regulator
VEPEKILRIVCREFGVNREELLKRGNRGVGRGLLMEFLYRYGGMNQREIGALMGVDYSAASVSRKRFQAALVRQDGNLLEQIEKIKAKISQG